MTHRAHGRDAGFTLVEMVVALAVLAVVVSVASGLLLQSLNQETRSRARSAGTSLLSQKLEALRGTATSAIALGTSSEDSIRDGVTYTVTTTSSYVDDSSATGDVCTSSATSVRHLRSTVLVAFPDGTRTTQLKAETLRSVANAVGSASTGALAVRVTNAAGTTGLVAVPVAAVLNGTIVAAASTDGTGCAVITNLTPGNYVAGARSGDLVAPDGSDTATTTTLAVTAGGLTRGQVQLETARTATVTLDPVGAQVPSGLVFTLAGTFLNQAQLLTCPALPSRFCMSARPGTVHHLFADTYTIQAGACGNATALSAVTVDLRATPTANVVLPMGSVTVVVKKANGTPIADGRVIRFARSSASLCVLGTETATGPVATGSNTYALPYGTWTVAVPNNGPTSATTTSLPATTSSTARSTTLTLVVTS